jgi:sulfur relay (sulfurtransferase) DsrC/TusE family protein
MGITQLQQLTAFVAAEVDEEGFLENCDNWSESFADAIALDHGLTLDYEKLQLIGRMREAYMRNGSIISLRKMCRENEIDKKRIQKLFGSCLLLWRLSGLPYPGEEARSYLS